MGGRACGQSAAERRSDDSGRIERVALRRVKQSRISASQLSNSLGQQAPQLSSGLMRPREITPSRTCRLVADEFMERYAYALLCRLDRDKHLRLAYWNILELFGTLLDAGEFPCEIEEVTPPERRSVGVLSGVERRGQSRSDAETPARHKILLSVRCCKGVSGRRAPFAWRARFWEKL